MSPETVILLTPLLYNGLLIALGLASCGRIRDSADFYIGGRRLGPWVAAISAAASSSSAF